MPGSLVVARIVCVQEAEGRLLQLTVLKLGMSKARKETSSCDCSSQCRLETDPQVIHRNQIWNGLSSDPVCGVVEHPPENLLRDPSRRHL